MAQHYEQGAQPVPQWWKRYGSPELDALVEEGLAKNPDLAATGRSLAAAREQLRGQINSSLMPSVDAGGEVSRKRALTMPGLPDPTKLHNIYTGQIQARYEVDIFGAARFANEAESARVEQRASSWTRRAARWPPTSSPAPSVRPRWPSGSR